MTLLTPENKLELQKRLVSLAWSLGNMLVVALLNFASANLGLFNLPPWAIVALGLALNQATKAWANMRNR